MSDSPSDPLQATKQLLEIERVIRGTQERLRFVHAKIRRLERERVRLELDALALSQRYDHLRARL